MTKKKIRISRDHCEEVMDTLGNVENGIEFVDLNKEDLEAKKGYAGLLKRCDEMEKRIIKFETLCKQQILKVFTFENYDEFRNELRRDQTNRRAMRTDYFDIIESEILNEEKELDIFLENKSHNLEDLNALIERREILKKLTQLTQSNNNNNNNNNLNSKDNFLQNENNIININNNNENFSNFNNNDFKDENRSGLQFISGVILAENELKLRRTVFRVSYGIGLTTFWDINPSAFSILQNNNNTQNQNQNKNQNLSSSTNSPKKIFTIFLKNSDPENNYLLSKLIKICDALGATRYNIPSSNALPSLLSEIEREISKMEKVLQEQTNSIRSLIINKTGTPVNPSKYALYRLFFKKQKEIYLNLSKCKSSNSFYDGEIWVLNKKLTEINHAIGALALNSANHHGSKIEDLPFKAADAAPTFIDCNEFIWPFQEIVNTYGIPRYQEINPTVFNIVTFPFLFGVMFGDIGHGFILLLFAFYLCFNAEEIKANKKNSLFKPLLPGRYLLLLMGFFAFYSGWVYNEFFSIAVPVFGGSCYTVQKPYKDKVNEYYRKDRNCVYAFGMDPKWQMAQNELSFNNSVKMKLSVILGVFHMTFGILLKGFNCVHFKNKLALIFEFVPQLIFMLILFGYMDIMIILKWLRNWDSDAGDAPSLISQLMNIFLNPGNVLNKPLWEKANTKEKYFQETWHLIVLAVSLTCVPIMLFPKPILEFVKFSSPKQNQRYVNLSDEQELNAQEEEIEPIVHQSEEHQSFGDIFVHQSIETIEFVLGAISNTASYLRLWALSLAHGQLSKVFFQKALLGAFNSENVFIGIVSLIIGFFIFANVTFGVLMCMDLLECFLHTLRLHWVEFQNKFYKADGYKFNPFSFRQLLSSQFED